MLGDYCAADDVPGLLNMLACEWVQLLTEEALRAQAQERIIWRQQGRAIVGDPAGSLSGPKKEGGPFSMANTSAL